MTMEKSNIWLLRDLAQARCWRELWERDRV